MLGRKSRLPAAIPPAWLVQRANINSVWSRACPSVQIVRRSMAPLRGCEGLTTAVLAVWLVVLGLDPFEYLGKQTPCRRRYSFAGTLRPSTCKLSVHRYRGGTGEPTPVDDYIMATGALPDCPNGGDCKDLNNPQHCRQLRHPCFFSARNAERCPQMKDPEHLRLYSHIFNRDILDRMVLEQHDDVHILFKRPLNNLKNCSFEERERVVDLQLKAMGSKNKGALDEAIGFYSKGLDILPSEYMLTCRAEVFLQQKRPNHALIDCSRARQLNAKYPKSYRIAAVAYVMLGKWLQALEQAREAHRLSPNHKPTIQLHNQLLDKLKKEQSYSVQHSLVDENPS